MVVREFLRVLVDWRGRGDNCFGIRLLSLDEKRFIGVLHLRVYLFFLLMQSSSFSVREVFGFHLGELGIEWRAYRKDMSCLCRELLVRSKRIKFVTRPVNRPA